MARNARISIKVTTDMKKEMENLANSYGLSISSLGAYIVGQWMSEKKEQIARRQGATAGDYSQGAPE
jgi:hypothetical protein